MTAPKRIYLVRNVDTGDERLIRAANAAQARNHAARDTLSVEVASQDQLVALLTEADVPVRIEEAGRESEPQPALDEERDKKVERFADLPA